MICPTCLTLVFLRSISFSKSCSSSWFYSYISSISVCRSFMIFCFSYSSAVIAATSRLSSSFTCSICALIAAFLSFNYLFSLLRLMKRPRSPSIPIFLCSSMLPLSSTTRCRKTVYRLRSSKSFDRSCSFIFLFSIYCFS